MIKRELDLGIGLGCNARHSETLPAYVRVRLPLVPQKPMQHTRCTQSMMRYNANARRACDYTLRGRYYDVQKHAVPKLEPLVCNASYRYS